MRDGMQVGQFVLDRRLGQGGMAEVWLAHNALLGAPAAVKFLISPWAGHPELEERFLREAKRQGALDHPNIVKVYGFEYVEGHSFLIMQYIDGGSVDDQLVRTGRRPLDFASILQIASGALQGLGCAHERQIVHRDIKPSNIMLDANLHAYIGDFGLVMVLDEQRITRTGTLMGTPLYMSPEQILRPKQIDQRADIYSFGCVLFEMFTGRTPFEGGDGDTDFNIKMAHTSMPPPAVRQFNAAVPPEVEMVVMRCLEKDPNRRFATCGELRQALVQTMSPYVGGMLASDAMARTTPIPSPVPVPMMAMPPFTPPPPTPMPPPPRPAPIMRLAQRPAALAAISAFVVASLAGGTYLAVNHNPFVKDNTHSTNSSPKPKSNPSPVSNPSPNPNPPPKPSPTAGPTPAPSPTPGPVVNPTRAPHPDRTVEAKSKSNSKPNPSANPPSPQPTPTPNPQPPPQPTPAPAPNPNPPPITTTILSGPLHNVQFRVRLTSPISSESSEKGTPVHASVLAPPQYSGSTMDGVVTKAGRGGLIPGMRHAELLFTFHRLRTPSGTSRNIDSRVVSFSNSRGEPGRDEEGQKVDHANGAKKIIFAAAAGAVIGAVAGRSKTATAAGAGAGAGAGLVLTQLSGKGKVMSFAPGSTFVIRVSDR